ncbi:MAG TPA: glycoside hydrolase family 3 protein, partial [Megamonas hypermegale]|nr:glycoside hydrolase family 3 protein [Megamonas hypermegale]
VRAIKAGADIILVCHEYEHETDAYLGLLDAVNNGEISQERIDESVKRIVKAKLLHLM